MFSSVGRFVALSFSLSAGRVISMLAKEKGKSGYINVRLKAGYMSQA